MVDLEAGLNAFSEQFAAQLDSAGAPGSEHGIHFCLALAFQAAYDLPLGAIVFEAPDRGNRIDLVVAPPIDLAVEVKYHRPTPSGSNRPFTQIYGQLLADFNKIARVVVAHRLVVLVTDQTAARHIQRSGRDMLPLELGDEHIITPDLVRSLPATAARVALTHGDWTALAARLAWVHHVKGWSLFAWTVTSTSS